MATEEKDVKELDILSDIKKIDRATRAKALAQVLGTLKEKAHEIVKLKEETLHILDAIGVKEDDMKRVIDFVNSLDEIQLTESEKRDIKDDAREYVADQKRHAEKKVTEQPSQQQFGITYVFPGTAVMPAQNTWIGYSQTAGYGTLGGAASAYYLNTTTGGLGGAVGSLAGGSTVGYVSYNAGSNYVSLSGTQSNTTLKLHA